MRDGTPETTTRRPGAPRLRASMFGEGLVLAALLPAAAGCTSDLPLISAEPPPRVSAALPPPPEGGYSLDAPYPLLPGDTVDIFVRDDPDLSIQGVEIPDSGFIEVWKSEKEGGEREKIPARGMTPEQLKEAIADVYERVIFKSRPYVQVRVAEAVRRVVFVRGAVQSKEGFVELPKGGRLTLWRAIQAAGGVTEDGDLSRVSISRRDPATGAEASLPAYDLAEMEENANYDRDPPLEPNDIVTVPRLGRVSISGNINQPGSYLCRRGMKLLDLVAEAGGYKQFSKLRDIHVVRNEGTGREKAYRVDLYEILAGKSQDPVLAPGDRVWIDEDWM